MGALELPNLLHTRRESHGGHTAPLHLPRRPGERRQEEAAALAADEGGCEPHQEGHGAGAFVQLERQGERRRAGGRLRRRQADSFFEVQAVELPTIGHVRHYADYSVGWAPSLSGNIPVDGASL